MSVRFRHDHAGCGRAHACHHEALASSARPFAFASSPRHFERDRPFAVEHIALDLELDFEKRAIVGSAALTVRRVDPDAHRIELDAVGFSIASVQLDGKSVDYTYDGKILDVELPSKLTRGVLTVTYRAVPRRGLWFREPDEHVPDRPRQAWTQFQEEDARHVMPCHDKPHVKMTTEARIRVPKGFYVLSNGELVAREEGLFHWKMSDPLPSYLVTIVAGEFAEIEDRVKVDGRDVPLTYLVPKGREDDGKRSFAHTPEMIAHFSELTGIAYPWNKYAQVVVSDFFGGGMENTTATTMYEDILLDERAALDTSSDDLVAHEAAHQWFGNFVTCRDWSEGWLNEGFATLFEHLWREKHLGKDEYHYGLRTDLQSYVGEAHGRYRRPVVCQDYDAPLDLFDRHLYEKGGLALHVLRTELGDALFWKGVNLYLTRHAHGIVETRDLLRALEEVSGRSLGRRFEEMIYKPGHPEIEIELSWADGVLTCAVKQHQSTHDGVPNAFELPITLLLDGDRRETVKLASRVDTFAIRAAERPKWVVVDPDLRILGDVTVKAPPDMLRAQLESAPSARGRWLAVQALAKHDDPVTIAALRARVEDEKEFWGVRAQCAAALGKIRARECEQALVANIGTKHPKVRRAVVAALGAFRTGEAAKALQSRALRDPSCLVEAEAARALGKTRQQAAFDVLLDVLDRPSWANVISRGAVDGLAALRDERALPHLFARTRYGHPRRVRSAAALALPKLSSDRRAREHLEDLLDDEDPNLRIDVVLALSDLGDARSRAALRARLEVDLDARVRRRIREVLRELGGERKQNEAAKEELEKLQTEHAELKARVSRLEARILPNKNPPEKKAQKGTKRARRR